MTDHTPAAQATKQETVLTDGDIRAITETFGGGLLGPIQFARAVETALLSKLRAPVADESPMAKMADALREKARQEQQTYQDRRAQATEWGPLPEGTEADLLTRNAPVAHVAGDETSRYLDWAKDRSAWEMPVGTPVYYSALASAPVAGEAQRAVAYEMYNPKTGHAIVDYSRHTYVGHLSEEAGYEARPLVYAAPQASEVVPKLPRGWQLALNLAIDAIENAAPTGQDWPVNWPVILHGLTELRAALSAQPGAQKEKNDE